MFISAPHLRCAPHPHPLPHLSPPYAHLHHSHSWPACLHTLQQGLVLQDTHMLLHTRAFRPLPASSHAITQPCLPCPSPPLCRKDWFGKDLLVRVKGGYWTRLGLVLEELVTGDKQEKAAAQVGGGGGGVCGRTCVWC